MMPEKPPLLTLAAICVVAWAICFFAGYGVGAFFHVHF
jgi:hypothetical protein